MERRWKEEVRERESEVREGGGVPLIPRYNAHITFPSPWPPTAATFESSLPPCRFASRTFLVLLANLIDISQFLTPSAPYPRPVPFFLGPLLSLSLLPPSGAALRVRPQNKREGGRWWPVGRTERRRGIFLPSNRTSEEQQRQRQQHGAAPERAALLPAGTLCASCKYLSAYCITRHDNVRPRLRLSLPSCVLPPSLYRD